MLPQDLCETYREANLRFPQLEIGIVPLMAELMLRHGPDYMAAALAGEFSPAQVAAIRDAMDRSHAARHVPVLSDRAVGGAQGVAAPSPQAWGVSDARLRLVWRNITYYVVDAIVDCLEALEPGLVFPRPPSEDGYQQLAVTVTHCLRRDRLLREQAAHAFALVLAVLDGDQARALARQFRTAVDYRDMAIARDALERAKRDLQRSLAGLLADAVVLPYPAFAASIRTCAWRAFRRDVDQPS